ncbi:MAG: leucine-rich repeat domain-containing protein [Bacteroidaceae bacterium]|nr:leucine-rich repeat domain-containing protein [Bacteroidaceae bacterium]
MKKTITLKTLMLVLVALFSINASAYDAEIDGFYYNFSGNEASVTYQNRIEVDEYYEIYNYESDYSGDVVIPQSVVYKGKTYSVTSIGDNAFADCAGLTSVSIPKSVISIGGDAFSGCKGLTSVSIPKSVTSIGGGAFYGCKGLTSIIIPNSVKTIGKNAFGDTGLTSVTIPNSITSIEDYVFYGCYRLISVTIPGSVRTIGDCAFGYCTGLTSIELPNGVTEIYLRAFMGCKGLTSVTIPNSVTDIESLVFAGCDNITTIYSYMEEPCLLVGKASSNSAFENNVFDNATLYVPKGTIDKYKAKAWRDFAHIEEWAGGDIEKVGDIFIEDGLKYKITSVNAKTVEFVGYEGAKPTGTLAIPAAAKGYSVSSIGGSALWGCPDLTGIVIPACVRSIGDEVFGNCTGLTSVTIGSNVTSIGNNVFGGCASLAEIVVASDNPEYDSRDNCNAIIETKTNTLVSGCKNTIIPNGVTAIGKNAFSYCAGLTSIVIPNSVKTIGYRAFEYCEGLASVVIGSGVTAIEEGAFSHCTGLTSIVIPNSVTTIGADAFWGNTGLTSVVLGRGLTDIGVYAFYNSDNISCIISYIENPFPTQKYKEDRVFSLNVVKNATLYVPEGTIGKYRLVKEWLEFVHIEEGIGGLEQVDDIIIVDGLKYTVTSVVESRTVELTGYDGAKPTGALVIPTAAKGYSVISIGAGAFQECTGLTSVSIPATVTTIKAFAFSECTGLTSFTIPHNVTEIKSYTFSGCTGLTSVTIPDGVTYIGSGAFEQCAGLTSIEIPNGVTYIGYRAFEGCSGLTSVSIPNGMISIGYSAFSECNNITTVYSYMEVPCHIYGKNSDYRAFPLNVFNNAALFVPVGTIGNYKETEGWQDFVSIEEFSGVKKCATPTIAYRDGKLIFECNTKGVEFKYDIKASSAKSGVGDEVDFTPVYTISVYATKVGYENSDTVTMEISNSGGNSTDVNGDGTVDTQDVLEIYQYIQEH